MEIKRSEKNALLNCLAIVAKLYQSSISIENITDGLPLKQGSDKYKVFSYKNRGLDEIFSRVANSAGFSSKLINDITLSKIPQLLLPIILLLKDDKACVITALSADATKVKVIMPEIAEDEGQWVETKVLEQESIDACFLINPIVKEEQKSIEKSHWFWGSLRYSKWLYFDVLLASFLLNIFMLATPLFTMNIYDRVVPNAAFDTLWILSIAIIVVFVFDALMKFLRTYTLEMAAKKSDVIMASTIFQYVLNIKLSNRFTSVGSFASNLKEFDTIRSFLASASMALIIDLPFLVIFLIVIYIIGGEIVFIPIVAALLIISYSLIIKKPLKKSLDRVSKSSAYKNGILIESLNTIETIKSLVLQSHIQWKWEESVGEIAKDEIRLRLLSNSITIVSSFVVQLSIVSVLILGVYAISEQSLSMGGLIALVMLTSRTLAPLNQFAGLISNYEHMKSSYKIIDEIMQLPTDYTNEQKFVERKNIQGSIEFKNVKFKYKNTKQYILDDVSFKILPSEQVGVIGPNGSGKSTILKLIMGLYEPESGSILIDGIDIHQINPYGLKKSIAYVPQDVVLFRGTLQENIGGFSYLSDEKLIEISQKSGVEAFVARNLLGYSMPIGEGGEGISGGERQAIGLARALVKERANIVLMDEPTSMLDSNSQLLVEQSIKEFSVEKTLLMVTHKQTLLQFCKRLILLKDGKVLLDSTQESVLSALSNSKVKR
ncbi:MAG: type I secretion system permease/ATPase [Epsilonproteobacteria bacterium]|nr:type I secretion system permease/ATPase [Campylobacterota bacterium]